MNSYKSQNRLIKQKQQREEAPEITIMRTSNESHLFWKKHSQKNPLYFGVVADFEADNKVDNSSKDIKRTNNFKQNPILNGYYIVPELDKSLQKGYYESNLGYDTVDWFVYEVKKKLVFHFQNTNEDIVMTKEDEGKYRKTFFVDFVIKF